MRCVKCDFISFLFLRLFVNLFLEEAAFCSPLIMHYNLITNPWVEFVKKVMFWNRSVLKSATVGPPSDNRLSTVDNCMTFRQIGTIESRPN